MYLTSASLTRIIWVNESSTIFINTLVKVTMMARCTTCFWNTHQWDKKKDFQNCLTSQNAHTHSITRYTHQVLGRDASRPSMDTLWPHTKHSPPYRSSSYKNYPQSSTLSRAHTQHRPPHMLHTHANVNNYNFLLNQYNLPNVVWCYYNYKFWHLPIKPAIVSSAISSTLACLLYGSHGGLPLLPMCMLWSPVTLSQIYLSITIWQLHLNSLKSLQYAFFLCENVHLLPNISHPRTDGIMRK